MILAAAFENTGDRPTALTLPMVFKGLVRLVVYLLSSKSNTLSFLLIICGVFVMLCFRSGKTFSSSMSFYFGVS